VKIILSVKKTLHYKNYITVKAQVKCPISTTAPVYTGGIDFTGIQWTPWICQCISNHCIVPSTANFIIFSNVSTRYLQMTYLWSTYTHREYQCIRVHSHCVLDHNDLRTNNRHLNFHLTSICSWCCHLLASCWNVSVTNTTSESPKWSSWEIWLFFGSHM